MCRHLQTLLQCVVTDPAIGVDALPMVTDHERRQLLVEWNATEYPYASHECIHQFFEAQVVNTPDAIALVFDGAALTYREFNSRANRLAHYLRSSGVGPESLVGLCLERSPDVLIGIMAILKAGGAYVPLDSGLPRERLAFMIQDTRLAVLLTQSSLEGAFSTHRSEFGAQVTLTTDDTRHPTYDHLDSNVGDDTSGLDACHAPRVMLLDRHSATIAKESSDNPVNVTNPENTAYVIYTSGSTGNPKGVLAVHRGVVNHNLAFSHQINLERDDRVLQFHSIAFDGAVEEMFPTWIKGGCVVLRNDALPSVRGLMELAGRQELTVLELPTAYWHMWAQELPDRQAQPVPSIRLVAVGGERAAVGPFNAWRCAAHGVRWVNEYGPTEATVITTMFEPPPDFTMVRGLSIGRPIANTTVYLLNTALVLVPVEVLGELYIGGAGIARGYLNQPALTAARFLADPFASGERCYRTGDVARLEPNGQIDFVGRVDDQVKVRGFRVELGEIEATLRQHPGVAEAVVLCAESESIGTRLVAYTVSTGPATVDVPDLRDYVIERLPEYMVPQVFINVPVFPLTPGGKIDRRALPSPDGMWPELHGAFVGPRSETEKLLAGVWGLILGLRRVGIHDNFFELGGHSLLATQVVSRVRDTFAIDLPLSLLFERPTIAGLADLLDTMKWVDKDPAGRLQSGDDTDELTL